MRFESLTPVSLMKFLRWTQGRSKIFLNNFIHFDDATIEKRTKKPNLVLFRIFRFIINLIYLHSKICRNNRVALKRAEFLRYN